MSTAPKILALHEIEPPIELAEALSHEFLRPLGIENPPPVRLAKRPAGANWGGYCQGLEHAEHGEVVMNDHRRPPDKKLMVEWFRGTYLHEITHRFLSRCSNSEIGGSHGPVFFAAQLLLFFRAGEREKSGRPWFLSADLYDLQDAWLAKEYTPGQALDWAVEQAEELAEQKISAEAATGEIVRRYAAWRAAMAAAPARRRAAREKEKAWKEELARLKNRLFGTRVYLTISFFFSIFLILFLGR